MFARLKSALLTLLFLAAALRALAHPFATIVSFGDSLSDTTNNPAIGDYWQGRYCNGPLWDELLASNIGAAFYDYAFSGSQTSDLSNQVAAALGADWNATNTLFTVWSGANDFIDNAAANGVSFSAWENTIDRGVQNIAAAVSMLAKAGADYVIVLDLPDLSRLPALETNAQLSAEASTVRSLVNQFNAGLSYELGLVLQQHAALRLVVVDDFTLLDNIIAQPEADGFTVVTNDALDALGDAAFGGPGADYLFWDVIHPTTKTHGLLAQLAEMTLDEFAPELVSAPADQAVAVGAAASFSVTALDATSYQWYFKGHPIAHATNANYTVTAATAARSGLYDVKVSNASGVVTSPTARLIVENPPRITVQPRSQNGIAGRSVALSSRAAGAAPLAYQWQFNGANIAGATRPALLLTNLQTNETGSYTLTVTNLVGAAASHVAILNVIVPPQIIAQPTNVTAVFGSAVTFSAQANGTGPLHYQWERNGAAIRGQTNAACTISGVKLSQAGRYRVLVRNQGGSVLSAPAILTVTKS